MSKRNWSVGDRVVIARRVEIRTPWDSDGEMENTLGMEGVITEHSTHYIHRFLVRFNSLVNWHYDEECFDTPVEDLIDLYYNSK